MKDQTKNCLLDKSCKGFPTTLWRTFWFKNTAKKDGKTEILHMFSPHFLQFFFQLSPNFPNDKTVLLPSPVGKCLQEHWEGQDFSLQWILPVQKGIPTSKIQVQTLLNSMPWTQAWSQGFIVRADDCKIYTHLSMVKKKGIKGHQLSWACQTQQKLSGFGKCHLMSMFLLRSCSLNMHQSSFSPPYSNSSFP